MAEKTRSDSILLREAGIALRCVDASYVDAFFAGPIGHIRPQVDVFQLRSYLNIIRATLQCIPEQGYA